MQLLMITHNPVGRGADYARAYNLGRHLAQRGHEVTLMAASRGQAGEAEEQTTEGLSVWAIVDPTPAKLARSGYSPVALYRRLIAVRGRSFDVVHTFGHRPVVSVVARRLHNAKGVRHVADWSDLWGLNGIAAERSASGRWTVGLLDDWWERLNVRRADGVTAVSSTLRDLAKEWGQPEGRVLELGIGAAVDVILPQPKGPARARIGLGPGAPVMIHSGLSAFDRDHVLKIALEICDRHPQAVVLLVGVNEGALGGARGVGRFAGRLRSHAYVQQDELGGVLACADLVLVPLRDRPYNRARFPNRVGDAMAAGRPVVTNPVGHVGRLVNETEIGVVAPEEPAEMAAAAVEALNNPRRLEALGRRARKLAEERFDWALLAERVESFYVRVLGG